MAQNQQYDDAMKKLYEHEHTCSFCNEKGFVNKYVCPEYHALVVLVQAKISPEQEQEALAYLEELDKAKQHPTS